MAITQLVNIPTIANPNNFDAYADNLLSVQLPTLVDEINTATLAMNLNATQDTSSTSNAIGTGSKTFTVTAGKSFLGGMFLIIADTAAPSTNAMYCQVTSYSGTTLVVNVISVQGSGTKTAWLISQSGYQFNLGAAMAFNGSITAPGLFSASPTTGIGYSAGAGSTVQQLTSKSTAVTINNVCGSITTHSASLAAGAVVTFDVNNSTVASSDVPILAMAASGGNYNVWVTSIGAGLFRITLQNIAGGALGENIPIRFAIIKAVSS
jgi:hypothetical protein